jgi:hypothetical protein
MKGAADPHQPSDKRRQVHDSRRSGLASDRRAGLLRGVLGGRYNTGHPRDRGGYGPPGVPQHGRDVCVQRDSITISGWTSTEPFFVDGMDAAYATAPSRATQSRT